MSAPAHALVAVVAEHGDAVAKSELVRMAAEIGRLRAEAKDWRGELRRLDADNDRLRAALRAFLECRRINNRGEPCGWSVGGGPLAPMHLGRAEQIARAALDEDGKP